jgi:hypothetical protein
MHCPTCQRRAQFHVEFCPKYERANESESIPPRNPPLSDVQYTYQPIIARDIALVELRSLFFSSN